MDYPTREEFEVLKHRFEQLERETEPMRLERRLSIPEANTLQTIMDMVGTQATDIGVLKGTVALRADVEALRADMEKRFDSIAQVQQLILDRLPEKGV